MRNNSYIWVENGTRPLIFNFGYIQVSGNARKNRKTELFMRKTVFLILIVFSFGTLKMEAQKNDAADEILFKIVKAGVALREKKQLNQDDLREIVCLSNISTQKWDGNFVGVFYFPSETEVQLWKDWFENNKAQISYSTNSEIFNKIYYKGKQQVIQVEYENGKFRNSVCGEDQNFQEVWKNRTVKN